MYMSTKKEKIDRKKIIQDLKQQNKQKFRQSLPASQEVFQELFDYLDSKFDDQGCNHTNVLTVKFLNDHDLSPEPIINWLKDQGGYCDCEILANVEDKFHDGIL